MKIRNNNRVHMIYILILSFGLSLFIFNISLAQQNTKNEKKKMNDSTLMMRRRMIHSRSHMVMPFNMSKVTHYFIDTNNGGVLMIKAKDEKDREQIGLIRKHLKKESNLFSKAEFRDPQTLHGVNMPGLKVLTQSKGKFKVVYKILSDGAQLTFTSDDSTVINAFHVWFAAQLKDHGNDARSHE